MIYGLEHLPSAETSRSGCCGVQLVAWLPTVLRRVHLHISPLQGQRKLQVYLLLNLAVSAAAQGGDIPSMPRSCPRCSFLDKSPMLLG